MKTLLRNLLGISVIISCTILMLSCDNQDELSEQVPEKIAIQVQESIEISKHSYTIRDCYTEDGKWVYHNIDSYVRNIDRSISFVGEDGLITTLPYPYFEIIVNPNQ